jgi:hypothetical protein
MHRFQTEQKKTVQRYYSIPKGRGNQYSLTKLLKHARTWEEELIISMEEEMAVIRSECKTIADLRKRATAYKQSLIDEDS